MLAGKITLKLDEVMTTLKESQSMMGGEKSSWDSYLLAVENIEREREEEQG